MRFLGEEVIVSRSRAERTTARDRVREFPLQITKLINLPPLAQRKYLVRVSFQRFYQKKEKSGGWREHTNEALVYLIDKHRAKSVEIGQRLQDLCSGQARASINHCISLRQLLLVCSFS